MKCKMLFVIYNAGKTIQGTGKKKRRLQSVIAQRGHLDKPDGPV